MLVLVSFELLHERKLSTLNMHLLATMTIKNKIWNALASLKEGEAS
jgi:hypothetical protein